MSETTDSSGIKLNMLLARAGLDPLDHLLIDRFQDYLSLLMRWNARVNLTAIRDEEGILSRHFVESIACARALPPEIATLLDFGSGAGFPGIPIALCRSQISVTLAESHGKKAAFLREAVRVLGISSNIYAERAELLSKQFDCVTLRAVDKMPQAVRVASRLVAPGGWLALMTTTQAFGALEAAAGPEISWRTQLPLPESADGLMALGTKGADPS